MTWLELLLWFKIIFTALTCSVPLLFLPGESVARLYGVGLDAAPLCRLYGVAITALLIGYGAGLGPASHGLFPTGVVLMGIFSNAGATATLIVTGVWARIRALTAVFGGIAIALVAALLSPGAFLTRAF